MGDMVFDLVCQHCGGRDVRRWTRADHVAVTYCRFCQRGMSVVGIAFFAAQARSRPAELAAA